MFENYTYEELLTAMLSEVPSNVDKREGSIIFDTLSPAALELTKLYMGLDSVLNNAFAETAIREYLIKIAKERGLTPESATNAILKGEFNFISNDGEYIGEVVSEGDRFNLDKINYVVTHQLTNDSDNAMTITDNDGNIIAVNKKDRIPGMWALKCETAGTVGNTHFGTMTPIETISGLTKAEITDLLIPGEDEEDTEVFRQRYFDSINSEAFGGNRANYIKWVQEMDGVGQVKVKRTPNGGGTVGVIITDSEGNSASEELQKAVKEALDPEEYEGQGEGLAPIGHKVTVSTVSVHTIAVYFNNIALEAGLENSDIQNEVVQILMSYANEINENWGEKETIKVYAAQVLARCLDIDGVINIESADLAGHSYITLDENEILKLTLGGLD
ncbi:MAG: baseplate J/gp47 family protein [Clostridia bacterium]|nr:baseplate J/gp47 family protein [Clostridia bacterium]